MTWKELKELAEAEGVKDDDDIWYIDISFPEPDLVYVGRDEHCGICIH